jgi:hypothetical protein
MRNVTLLLECGYHQREILFYYMLGWRLLMEPDLCGGLSLRRHMTIFFLKKFLCHENPRSGSGFRDPDLD